MKSSRVPFRQSIGFRLSQVIAVVILVASPIALALLLGALRPFRSFLDGAGGGKAP